MIAIAGGADKVAAIAATARAGLIHRLITDSAAADALLQGRPVPIRVQRHSAGSWRRSRRRARRSPSAVTRSGLISTSARWGWASSRSPRATTTAPSAARSSTGPPRQPSSRARPASSSGIVGGLAGVQRREPHGDVGERLGDGAAEPDQHDRPEHRVAAGADDQVDPGRGHRLDEEPAGAGRSSASSAASSSAGVRTPRCTPPTSVLCSTAASSSFTAIGPPQLGEGAVRRPRSAHARRGGVATPERGQHRLGLRPRPTGRPA